MKLRHILSVLIAVGVAWVPTTGFAQQPIELSMEVSVDCDLATFSATAAGGTAPFMLSWEFGDGDMLEQMDIEGFPVELEHQYPTQGDYSWSLTATDDDGASGHSSGELTIEGPTVSLDSNPFPPLLYLQDGEATVEFDATVSGGTEPYTYVWDLDGDGAADPGGEPGQAAFAYSEAGGFLATVTVTDACGMSSSDSLRVVVIDLDEGACHPMAQRIADAVNTLFPDQAEQLYTCADIYDYFNGGLIGSQLGFGRMWHAYHLAQTLPDLSWEEIRDWHLAGNGWGGLVQLNRYAEALDEVGLRQLFDMVVLGEASLGDIRHAVHAVARYDADFEDALSRMTGGMSPGELGRFYRTAQDLGLDAATLDLYLADGMSLQELSHAARVAGRTGADWEQIAEAHAAGYSWGAIQQAQRLAGDGDWMSVLENGIQETRQQLRDEAQQERKEGRQERQETHQQARDDRTAAQLARQHGVSEAEVWALYDGACGGDWKCVRAALREASGKGGGRKP